MPASSLLAMCTRTAIHNAKNLMDIGNIPYSLARPFLLKIESPAQLHSLELQSPHIMQDDRELWIEFIKRDVPQWDRFELPETSDCWYDIYRDLIEQVQREVDEDAERLKLAVDQINSKRASSGSKFLGDRQIPRLPKPRPTRVQRYAAHDRKMGGITPTFSASYSADGEKIWSLEAAPRLRPERAGRSEAKKSNIFAAKRNKALAVPMHRLKTEASQIKQVPQWLVDEHKQPPPVPRRAATASSPKSLSTVPFAARASASSPTRSSTKSPTNSPALVSFSASSSLQARESRLKALTSKHSIAAAPSSSASATSPHAKPVAGGIHSALSPSASSRRPARHLSPSDETRHRQQSSSSDPEREPSRLPTQTSKSASPPATLAYISRGLPLPLPAGGGGAGPPPAPALIRKRPAPNVFIQPKRKKV